MLIITFCGNELKNVINTNAMIYLGRMYHRYTINSISITDCVPFVKVFDCSIIHAIFDVNQLHWRDCFNIGNTRELERDSIAFPYLSYYPARITHSADERIPCSW